MYPPPILALAPATQVMILVGILIAVVAVGGGFLLAYRRRLFEKTSQDQAGLLDSLRTMRDRGQITTDEFDATRKRMAARIAGVPPPPSVAHRPSPDSRTAPPGFDLTGAPLPPPALNPRPDKPPDPPSHNALPDS